MPINPSYPGVYVEEIASGVRTISGVATSIAAFVDCFKRGPLNVATRVLSMADFERIFGGLDARSEASYAIQQFFLNGGTQAWVVRVAGKTEPRAQAASVVIAAEDGHTAVLQIDAISSGAWGNNLRVVVDTKGAWPNSFNLTVSEYADTDDRPGVLRQEIFRNLSVDTSATNAHAIERVVNDPVSGSQLVAARVLTSAPTTLPAPNGSYSNGYTDPTHVDVPAQPRLSVALVSSSVPSVPAVVDVALSPGPHDLASIAPAVQQAIRGADFRTPALSGASVDVVDHALRILAGPCDDADAGVNVMTIGQTADDLASVLKLATTPAPAILSATLSGPLGAAVPISWPSMRVAHSAADSAIATLNPSSGVDIRRLDLPKIATLLEDALHHAWRATAGARQSVTDAAYMAAQVFTAVGADKKTHLVIQPGGTLDEGCFECFDATDRLATHLKLTASSAQQTHATVSAPLSDRLTLSASSTVHIGSASAPVALNVTDAGLTGVAAALESALHTAGQLPGDIFATARVLADTTAKRLVVCADEPVIFDAAGATGTVGALLLLTPDRAQRSGWSTTISDGFDAAELPDLTWPAVRIATDDGKMALARLAAPADIDPTRWIPLGRVRELLEASIRAAVTDAARPTVLADARVSIASSATQQQLLVTWGAAASGASAAAPEFLCDAYCNSLGTDLQLTPSASGRACTVTLGGPLDDPLQLPGTARSLSATIGSTTATVTLVVPSGVTAMSLASMADTLQTAIRSSSPAATFGEAVVSVVAESTTTGHLAIIPGGSSPGDRIVFNPVAPAVTPDPAGFVATTIVNAQAYTLGKHQRTQFQLSATQGQDGQPPDASAIIGELSARTGIYALEDADQFNLLCLPAAARLGDSDNQAVLSVAAAYCEKRRAILLVDVPDATRVGSYADALNWLGNVPRSANAAIYYPRVQVPDPLDSFRPRARGASGTVAGVFARTDATRGVWKAPAGIDAAVLNVSGLDDALTDLENGVLNQAGINCLRTFPIYRTVVWGARTLVGSDAEASEWKYLPVRRTALFVEESLNRGLKWVVFEPNDEPLWSQIRLNVGAFMQNLFRQGAFQGQTPREAYFVKCDGETTTQTDINLGRVNIVVGFAPLKPAEFVIIQLQQMAGQPAL